MEDIRKTVLNSLMERYGKPTYETMEYFDRALSSIPYMGIHSEKWAGIEVHTEQAFDLFEKSIAQKIGLLIFNAQILRDRAKESEELAAKIEKDLEEGCQSEEWERLKSLIAHEKR